MPRVVVRHLERESHPAAARIITEALLHDPGWLAVGPARTGHRRFVAHRFHRAAVAVAACYVDPRRQRGGIGRSSPRARM
jgi:hypothetical protein